MRAKILQMQVCRINFMRMIVMHIDENHNFTINRDYKFHDLLKNHGIHDIYSALEKKVPYNTHPFRNPISHYYIHASLE